MTRADLIEFNKEILQKMKQAGIRLDDYKYCDLYRDYTAMTASNASRKVVLLTLAERYGISDRQVYNIVSRLSATV